MQAMATATCHGGIKSILCSPALGTWVSHQRTAIKNGTLQPDRVARLKRIGFQADPTNETWNANFTKLVAYRKSNGHCNVPQGYKTIPALKSWVDKQRTAIRNDTLQPDRATRLEIIGFKKDRASNDEKWNRHFTKLVAYHESNGHCNVPQGYKADPALGRWVTTQHATIKKGTRKLDQVTLLNAIGFQASRKVPHGECSNCATEGGACTSN